MTKTNNLRLVPYETSRPWVEGVPREEWPEVTKLAEYAGLNESRYDWRPNEPFEATLTLERLERGRSAARFWFVDERGTRYPFFGQGLVDMLSRVILDHGRVRGTWIAVKRGANYGLELLEEHP
ncbi:hypothetical protein [Streptomyces sp. AC495_CC817]|uniref:hypothetical protein n=1 Tax=Streptomyces sp. AC495_CC817 TaxID=2823900 RepID=UPI001C280B5A|nr:hypothetical protein [Streptomyces sp. AC495_CC817]